MREAHTSERDDGATFSHREAWTGMGLYFDVSGSNSVAGD